MCLDQKKISLQLLSLIGVCNIKNKNMKISNFLIIVILLIGIISCENDDLVPIDNPGVENYIELLKSNQYDALTLPEFTNDDIPALLTYRNEIQVITDFPHNGISSLYAPDCKLGMYVLWTIESIRAVAIESDHLIGRFPSQNPILALRESDDLELVYTNESHEMAANAYFDWWDNNKGMDFDDFKNIGPLIETDYRWH